MCKCILINSIIPVSSILLEQNRKKLLLNSIFTNVIKNIRGKKCGLLIRYQMSFLILKYSQFLIYLFYFFLKKFLI